MSQPFRLEVLELVAFLGALPQVNSSQSFRLEKTAESVSGGNIQYDIVSVEYTLGCAECEFQDKRVVGDVIAPIGLRYSGRRPES